MNDPKQPKDTPNEIDTKTSSITIDKGVHNDFTAAVREATGKTRQNSAVTELLYKEYAEQWKGKTGRFKGWKKPN